MGREAQTLVRLGSDEIEAQAMLETSELILRGGRKARWPLNVLSEVSVDGDWLAFTSPDGPVALRLGARDAASWARKMTTPPPSLADKLGLKPGARVQVIGEIEDPALEAAVAGHLALAAEATLSLAVVESQAALNAALSAHAALPADAHIWIANVKGPKSPFGENAVRTAMRAAGYMDNKTAAVSDRLAATRYARAKA